MKGSGVDAGAGRGIGGGSVQELASIRNKAAPPAAATPKGQPSSQSLPEGVDEMTVFRQISDGLRLRPGRNQTAIIRLHPMELGQVQVKVQVEGSTARILVNTEHASVGEVVSSQLDQLRRDIMAQGVQVTHLEVRNELGNQHERNEQQAGEREELEEQEKTTDQPRVRARRGDGRIDVQA